MLHTISIHDCFGWIDVAKATSGDLLTFSTIGSMIGILCGADLVLLDNGTIQIKKATDDK